MSVMIRFCPDVTPAEHRRFKMRSWMRLAVIALGLGVPAMAHAQSPYPNLTGQWTADLRSIILGDTPQWPDAVHSKHAWLGHLTTTIQIEHETGDLFWGQFIMAGKPQEVLGVFTGDGTRFLISMRHGIGEGFVISPTHIRICYTQFQTQEIHAQVAGCNDATRQ